MFFAELGRILAYRSSDAALRSTLRDLPRTAVMLCIGALINQTGAMVLPFLSLYVTGRGYSATAAGSALAAYGVGAIVSPPVGGFLADSVGRRYTIALSMFCSSITALLFIANDSLLVIYVLAFAFGASTGVYRPAAAALLTDITGPTDRTLGFASWRLATNLGLVVGLILGGALAARSTALLFSIEALSSMTFGVIALVSLPRSEPAVDHHGRGPSFLRTLLADGAVLRIVGADTLVRIVEIQAATTLALQLTAAGYSPFTYGLLLALNAGLVVLFEVPLLRRMGQGASVRIVAIGSLVVGLGFTMPALSMHIFALVAGVLVWSIGEMLQAPRILSFVADRAPADARGRYQGILMTSRAIALAVGPIVGLSIYAWNHDAVWWFCGAVGAAAALLARGAGQYQQEKRG